MFFYEIKDDWVGIGMVSVMEVEVFGDLQYVKIFVSIYGFFEVKVFIMVGLYFVVFFVC